jgi:hypothetical protein
MVGEPPAAFDTSFWVHVFGAGLLPMILPRYTLRYAPAVALELPISFASGREFRRLAQSGELQREEPDGDRVGMFGPGERATINLVLEHPDWVLLLDDRRPFDWAEAHGIRVVCSPLLVVAWFQAGTLDVHEAERLLALLTAPGTMSPVLLQRARRRLATVIMQREEAEHG